MGCSTCGGKSAKPVAEDPYVVTYSDGSKKTVLGEYAAKVEQTRAGGSTTYAKA